MSHKIKAWNLTDEELIDELSLFSHWWGYPCADNKDEALGLIAEAVARMAKTILLLKTPKESTIIVDEDAIVFNNKEEFENTYKATEELIKRFDEEFGEEENPDED